MWVAVIKIVQASFTIRGRSRRWRIRCRHSRSSEPVVHQLASTAIGVLPFGIAMMDYPQCIHHRMHVSPMENALQNTLASRIPGFGVVLLNSAFSLLRYG